MLIGNKFQICGAEILKPRDPSASYAMVLPADENRMSANTLQADNTERGQRGSVDD